MPQAKELFKILETNKSVQLILKQAEKLNMPNWYLGAGGITQTVWNFKHGFAAENGIKDYDLVYCDSSNTSYEAEDTFIKKSKKLFNDIPALVEIKNQARVHLWYEKNFGKPIKQYKFTEEAINTWPTTATAVGVKKCKDGRFEVYAPFGLNDLFNMVVRANKTLITEKIYQDKIDRWVKIWPNLKIIPWHEK